MELEEIIIYKLNNNIRWLCLVAWPYLIEVYRNNIEGCGSP